MRNIVFRRETNVPGEDVHSCSLFLYQHLWDTTREVSEATLHSGCTTMSMCRREELPPSQSPALSDQHLVFLGGLYCG